MRDGWDMIGGHKYRVSSWPKSTFVVFAAVVVLWWCKSFCSVYCHGRCTNDHAGVARVWFRFLCQRALFWSLTDSLVASKSWSIEKGKRSDNSYWSIFFKGEIWLAENSRSLDGVLKFGTYLSISRLDLLVINTLKRRSNLSGHA